MLNCFQEKNKKTPSFLFFVFLIFFLFSFFLFLFFFFSFFSGAKIKFLLFFVCLFFLCDRSFFVFLQKNQKRRHHSGISLGGKGKLVRSLTRKDPIPSEDPHHITLAI